MQQYPKPLARLVNELSKLPGIGSKTAQRLAFHILSLDDSEAQRLADAITTAKRELRYCSVCGNLTDQDPCAICSDPSRKSDTICVVESNASFVQNASTNAMHTGTSEIIPYSIIVSPFRVSIYNPIE